MTPREFTCSPEEAKKSFEYLKNVLCKYVHKKKCYKLSLAVKLETKTGEPLS